MKYLEYTPLDRINDFLSHVNFGERTIKGCLEAYSCKHTGTDKKLSFSLENEILDYLGKSSDSDSSSPAEYLSCRSSRKMLVYLILTLYHMYPNYDFSDRKVHGIFEAASSGQMNINPYGWTADGSERTSYPAQIRMRYSTKHFVNISLSQYSQTTTTV